MTDWPFHDPPTCLAMTVRQIVCGEEWIYCVTHHEFEGGWQFTGVGPWEAEDVVEVTLEEMLKIDPSLLRLADLPRGWCAWREEPGEGWRRVNQNQHLAESISEHRVNEKREITSSPQTSVLTEKEKSAVEQEELWSVPQYGLRTLLGTVTGFAVLFSILTTLHIDLFKGLWGGAIVVLIVWLMVNFRRMIKLPLQTSQNLDFQEKADYREAESDT